MTFSINPTANKTQAMFKQMAIAQNGTGTASPITGGAAAPAPAPPAAATTVAAAPAPADSSAAGGVVPSTGTINTGGSCDCACLCAVGSFPSSALQGLGAFGGIPGQSHTFPAPIH